MSEFRHASPRLIPAGGEPDTFTGLAWPLSEGAP